MTNTAKLKIAELTESKPVKITLELPANVYGELVSYAEILSRQSGQVIKDPSKLIAPMLTRFMATDRVFVRSRKQFRKDDPHKAL